MKPTLVFVAAWVLWILSWVIAARWAARTERRAATKEEVRYRVPVVIGAILLFPTTSSTIGSKPLWHVGYGGAYALAGAAIAGLLFTWWARLHLGRLWSATITRKEGHRIIDTGPYALVRHPIYTGILFASLASAAAEATLPAIAGFVMMAAGFWLKARIEERFLAAELGEGAYADYRRRVPMLVPFFGPPPRS